ncbi:MAG: 1-acyl-sn-glycerol-3-phosphate acyltransferase [Deltaproteobacteria bacterium]|nr:1-acyl-sn-glycerol-3-phosphate acyltransferase [Deltaproteobacteria bacterium]
MVDRPGVVLKFLFRKLFGAIHFGEEDAARIRHAASRGPVVYVLRTVSYLEYLYFNYALSRNGLPLARFANGGVRTVLLWPIWIAVGLLLRLWRLARGARLESEEDAMARRLLCGDAALLFLRPSRRIAEGDARAAARVRGRFFEKLIEVQRQLSVHGKYVQLVPMTLLWGASGVRPAGGGAIDAIFGEPERPGRLREFIRFVWHHRGSVVKVAEPMDLDAFLQAHSGRSDDSLARTLRFEVSGAIERERRVVLGPVAKSARRIRTDVLRSRRLKATIDEIAAKKGLRPETMYPQAERIIREIAAAPTPWGFAFSHWVLSYVFRRIYEGIDLCEESLTRVKEAAKQGPLILLPSHRSHVDYLVLSFVFYERGLAPPHVAAGKNLSFFPLGSIFRRCAAFFLRRSFRGDALYSAVFAAYVRRLLKERFNLEFFIEGGRSRTGKLLSPKLGLLRIVADAAIDGDAAAAQVVPVAITYEKVVEEGSYAHELAGGEKRKEDLGALLRARRVLRSRYGRIDLKLGEPFPLQEALAAAGAPPGASEDARKQAVRRLGHRVLHAIAQASAVTPSALVASSVLATTSRGLPRREVDRRARWLAVRARASGARFAAPLEEDFAGAVARAVELLASDGDFELRGDGDEQLLVVPDERRSRLEFYKNNAIHALGDGSIVARALLVALRERGGEMVDESLVRSRALTASRLLKNELIYRPGVSFDVVFSTVLAELEVAGWVQSEAQRCGLTEEGSQALPVLAGVTGSYLDAYRLVVRTAISHPKLVGKELVAKVVASGERALLLGETSRAEAISRPTFESALEYLRDAGALAEREKLRGIGAEIQQVIL